MCAVFRTTTSNVVLHHHKEFSRLVRTDSICGHAEAIAWHILPSMQGGPLRMGGFTILVLTPARITTCVQAYFYVHASLQYTTYQNSCGTNPLTRT
jgi:hypothetical protein